MLNDILVEIKPVIDVILNYVLTPVLILFLVFCSGFFSSSETAFLSITKIQIRQMLKDSRHQTKRNKNSPAKKIEKLKNDMDGFLTLILIGNNFVNTLSPALATAMAIKIAGEKGATVSTVFMAFVIIIFAEIVPKTLAVVHPIPVTKKFAGPLLTLRSILRPLVFVFSKFTRGVGELVAKIWKNDEKTITEEELKKLIEVGAHEGTIENNEKKILYKIIALNDLSVHEIMRHRSLVKSISLDATYDECVSAFVESGFSKLPVYKDSHENIVGIIFYKTLLYYGTAHKEKSDFVKKCKRSVLFVPETMTAIEILQKFKKENTNFAIAVDENGENVGIVTMDDLMKAVMGLSIDQMSQLDIPMEQRVKVVSSTEMLVPGEIKLDEFNDYFGYDLESEDFATLGGWLLEQFGYLPNEGEFILRNGTLYKVEEQKKRRILSVRIQTVRK